METRVTSTFLLSFRANDSRLVLHAFATVSLNLLVTLPVGYRDIPNEMRTSNKHGKVDVG